MQSKISKLFILIMLCCGVSFYSCDDHNDDSLNLSTVEMNLITIPNGPAILNPLTLTESSFQQLELFSEPDNGIIDLIADNSLVRYSPNQGFIEGADQFTLDMTDLAGKKIAAKINVRMLDNSDPGDCTSTNGGVFDFIQMKSGESIKVDLLDNDIFCGGPAVSSSGSVSMVVLTNDDVIDVSGEPSINIGPGAIANITYTAPEDFTGIIEFVYELGMNGANSPNEPRIMGNMLVPTSFDSYVIAQATIEVVAPE